MPSKSKGKKKKPAAGSSSYKATGPEPTAGLSDTDDCNQRCDFADDDAIEVSTRRAKAASREERRTVGTKCDGPGMAHQAHDLLSDDPARQLHSVTELRILLSIPFKDEAVLQDCAKCASRIDASGRETDDRATWTVREVVRRGLVPRLVELLASSEDPKIQHESAWALTNIAASTSSSVLAVIEAGALPVLVKQIATGLHTARDEDLCEQCIWVLGNVAGDGAGGRDKVLASGVLPPLLELLKTAMPGKKRAEAMVLPEDDGGRAALLGRFNRVHEISIDDVVPFLYIDTLS